MGFDPTTPHAFLSYTRFDDKYLLGGISTLREVLEQALRARTGKPFNVFQDVEDIHPGDSWRKKLDQAISKAQLFIPVLTPSFFNSDFCRHEAKAFLDFEARARRDDLVLPIYLMDLNSPTEKSHHETDEIACRLHERQYADWRSLRFKLNDVETRQQIDQLAGTIVCAIAKDAEIVPPSAVPEALLSTKFVGPDDGAKQLTMKHAAVHEQAEATDTQPGDPLPYRVEEQRLGGTMSNSESQVIGDVDGVGEAHTKKNEKVSTNASFLFKEEDWGHLASRYRNPRPRKLLALDGGGMRGVITLRVLQRLETLLKMPLCDYFDYIAGTSTGAIIAACLAMGMKVEEIEKFYLDFGEEVFKKRWLHRRWSAHYSAKPLEKKLRQLLLNIAGTQIDPDLRPEFLRCLFMAVARNASTDSVWPISSNPAAKFNDPRDSDCNLRIPMWEILRASSAAPTIFPPHPIALDPRNLANAFTFVDGGTTAYNNPSFLLYRMATLDQYNLGWPKGEDKLLLVSVGTGISPAADQPAHQPSLGLIGNVSATVNALMHQAVIDQDTNCRMVGRCMHGHTLDYEIGDLILRDSTGQKIPATTDTGRDFLYLRYNTMLTKKRGLDKLGLDDIDISTVEQLDAVSRKGIEQMQKIGNALADTVDLADFGAFAPSS